jgi:hypothetical protein
MYAIFYVSYVSGPILRPYTYTHLMYGRKHPCCQLLLQPRDAFLLQSPLPPPSNEGECLRGGDCCKPACPCGVAAAARSLARVVAAAAAAHLRVAVCEELEKGGAVGTNLVAGWKSATMAATAFYCHATWSRQRLGRGFGKLLGTAWASTCMWHWRREASGRGEAQRCWWRQVEQHAVMVLSSSRGPCLLTSGRGLDGAPVREVGLATASCGVRLPLPSRRTPSFRMAGGRRRSWRVGPTHQRLMWVRSIRGVLVYT